MTLEILLYILTAIGSVVGAFVAVWSIIDTRRKFYEEYNNRRKK